jgi:phosphopantetheinyl transferase
LKSKLIKIPFHDWKHIEHFNLKHHQIHLWCIELPPHIKLIKTYENLHELKKQRHQLVKHLLKNYIQQDLNDTDFLILPSGKPILKNHELQYNITHSQHYLLLLIHLNKPVGIDFEYISRRHIQNFSKRFFGENWYETKLRPQRQCLQRIAFFQAWTQTEAWVKAHAETIFNFSAFEAQHLLSRHCWQHHNWQLLSFMPYLNGIASICCSSNIEEVFIKNIDLSQPRVFKDALIEGVFHG